jgi:hypothetical protein
MRPTIIIGLTALAIGAAVTPIPAFAQYWGYNQNGGVVALPGPHHRIHSRRLYNHVTPRGYNRSLPPGGATPGDVAPQ